MLVYLGGLFTYLTQISYTSIVNRITRAYYLQQNLEEKGSNTSFNFSYIDMYHFLMKMFSKSNLIKSILDIFNFILEALPKNFFF